MPPLRCWTPRECPRSGCSTTSSPPPRPTERERREESMATDTDAPVKERSVPKPVFTDAEAGAKEFPSSTSRTYSYFTPAKRRATVYEDVTVDIQPDPERHLLQGWIYGFADAEVEQLACLPRWDRGRHASCSTSAPSIPGGSRRRRATGMPSSIPTRSGSRR